MKKSMRLAAGGLLIASFVIGVMATITPIEAKPMLGCYEACNRTTYQIVECCPYIQKGDVIWRCRNTGSWCYPE